MVSFWELWSVAVSCLTATTPELAAYQPQQSSSLLTLAVQGWSVPHPLPVLLRGTKGWALELGTLGWIQSAGLSGALVCCRHPWAWTGRGSGLKRLPVLLGVSAETGSPSYDSRSDRAKQTLSGEHVPWLLCPGGVAQPRSPALWTLFPPRSQRRTRRCLSFLFPFFPLPF